MNNRDSVCEEQIHLAERELSSFLTAVTVLYGPERARLSAEGWLEESELMDSPHRSEARDWRAVTIAASARLANQVNYRAAWADAPRTSNLLPDTLQFPETRKVRLLDQSSPARMEVPLTRLALGDVL